MKYNQKYQVKVVGKMNEFDAGVVGRLMAVAVLVVAVLLVLYGVSLLRWW